MSIQSHREGVLTFATGKTYQEQAYCLALTARAHLGIETTVVVDRLEYAPLSEVANVVHAKKRGSKFEQESLAFSLSPYEVTHKTDADILFPLGTQLYHPRHLSMTSGVACSITGKVSNSVAYRKIESAIGLPPVYSALFSFDKSEQSREFFELVGWLFKNWYSLRLSEFVLKAGFDNRLAPTTDSVFSLAWFHLFGSSRVDGNRFVHMKPALHGWRSDSWVSDKYFAFDAQGRVLVDGIRVSTAFHYYDKTLITPTLIQKVKNVCSR